jgi:DNA-binding SARP family transcriptional activator
LVVVRVQVLGPVRAWRDGRELDLGPPGRRAVLGFLVLARGRTLPRAELVDALWGDRPPPSATNIIQTHVKHLRRLLDPERHAYARSPSLPTIGEGYALRLPPDQVDLERFHDLVRSAEEARRSGQQEQAATALGVALGLWQGPPLADLPSYSAQPAVLALVGARQDVVLAYAEVMIATRRAADVLSVISEESAAQPLDETLAAMLMRVYAAAGQRAKAFAVYDRTRRTLATELGVEPGPELTEVHATLVRQDPETPARPVPAELPADVAGFTGRADELAALDRLLAPDPPVAICAVSGTAGVGKTALVLHWAHRVRDRFPDGQLYLDLRGYDPDQPMAAADALARLLERLGVPDIPVTEDARAARYRTELAGRRMLVVLDNAASVEQVRGLLPGTPSCFVFVTSRDSLAGLVALHGSRRLDLDPLSHEDAKSLLYKLIGDRAAAEPDAVGDLVEQCARLPLALRVTAELAVTKPAISLAALAGELRDRQRRLRLLDAGGDARAAVRTVLSWSYRHLPADAAFMFRALGWHPGPDLDVQAAAALADLDTDAGVLLDRLVRAHLVVLDAHGRYGMHDLLRAYAIELSAELDSDVDRAAGLTRLLDHYLAATVAAMDALYPTENPGARAENVGGRRYAGFRGAGGRQDPRSWLDAERRNLVAACAHAAAHGLSTHAVRLANALYRYLEGGHHADALSVHANGLRAARECGDRSGEAYALTNLGAVHRLLGQYDVAIDHLSQALSLHESTGDRHGEARTLSNLGIVEDRIGEHDRAADHLDAALVRFREVGHGYGTAAVLTNLGGLSLRPGHYERAGTYLEEAATLFRALGDRAGEASALTNLGDGDTHLGRYEQAEIHLGAALALFRELKHRDGQAIALCNLGTVQTHLGRHDEAVAHLTEALTLFRETGHRYGEASVLNGLGEALHAAGRPDALAHHTAALRIATETGDRDEQERANTAIARLTTP